jgi:hypothetical protein
MFEFIKNLFKVESKLNIGSVRHSQFFALSTTTVFTEDELIDYAMLTGKKLPEIEKIMSDYMKYGIHSLWQINQIIKMGHYCA